MPPQMPPMMPPQPEEEEKEDEGPEESSTLEKIAHGAAIGGIAGLLMPGVGFATKAIASAAYGFLIKPLLESFKEKGDFKKEAQGGLYSSGACLGGQYLGEAARTVVQYAF